MIRDRHFSEMDIQCRTCREDFLFFETEFIRPSCNHLLHQSCFNDSNRTCSVCNVQVEEVDPLKPVTWNELDRIRTDCNRLLDILAEHVSEIAAADRKPEPIVWMNEVSNAVTRIAYPSVLIQKTINGFNTYQSETERLYIKDGNETLVNFGIPIRFNEETTNTINAVRRCIKELNKWMEIELTQSEHLKRWEEELRVMFPNLSKEDVY